MVLAMTEAMRVLGVCALLVGCTETGAHLTLVAPDGPSAATRFDVVLATPERVPSIAGQRVSARSLATQTVSYYLQRTIAGGDSDAIDHVDGFTLRIAPNAALTESDFIPFVLIYGDGGITGVATYLASDSQMPSPILVKRDEIDTYKLAVEPVTEIGDSDAPAARQVEVIQCGDKTSGIVWRPAHGGELRLLFPLDDSMDATGRKLDLDCDGHAVTIESSDDDCDDTRGAFHREAPETCDGYDTNCDGQQNLVVACPATSNTCADPTAGTGVALCDDRTGTQAQCQSDPQCLCAGVGAAGCIKCVVDNQLGTATGTVVPCQPGIGYLATPMCTDGLRCRVDVIGVHGGWVAAVSSDGGSFGSSASNVASKVFLQVKRPEGPGAAITGTRGDSTGEVDLVITPANGTPILWPVDLRLDVDDSTVSCASGGPYQMACSQL